MGKSRHGKGTTPVPQQQQQNRDIIATITRKDLIIQTFAAGGPGGQHQNTSNTGVRIIHPASGARGESREHRSQHQNLMAALHRMTETPQFRVWKIRMAAGNPLSPEEQVKRDMDPANLLIMGYKDGKPVVLD